MPKVSYIKAMDIFLGFCFIFVFAALIKLAIMKSLREKATAMELAGHRQPVELKRPVVLRTLPYPYSQKKSISRLVNYAATQPTTNDHQAGQNGRKISDFSLAEESVTNACCISAETNEVKLVNEPNPNDQLDKYWRRLNICKSFCLITYPAAFLTFCVYYFVVYVLNAKQTSMANCTFD